MNRYFAAVALVLLTLTFATAVMAADDPIIGTWKLNLGKSKITSGNPPKSLTYKYDLQGNTLRYVQDGINSEGKPTHLEGTVVLDGKDYPSDRTPTVDTYSESRIDSHTLLLTLKKDGRQVGTWRDVISRDGKTLTRTTTNTSRSGSTVLVFDKQ